MSYPNEKLLEKIEAKLDKLDTRLDTIDVRLGIYNEQLTIHIVRTNELQEIVTPIQSEMIAQKAIKERREADKRIATWVVGILGGLAGLYKLFL